MSEDAGNVSPPKAGLEVGDLTGAATDMRSQPEKDLATKTADWDKERQEREQTHANERKDLEGRLDAEQDRANTAETQLADLTAKVSGLEEQIGARPEKPPKPDEANEVVLDEETYGDVAKAIKAIRADLTALRTAPGADRSQDVTELAARLDRFEGTVTGIADSSALNSLLDDMDGTYGPEFRNDAQLVVKRHFAERGFSEAKPPPLSEMSARVEATYAKLKLAANEKAAKEAAEGGGVTEPIAGDPGTGGAVAIGDESSQFESPEAVAEDMKARGTHANLRW